MSFVIIAENPSKAFFADLDKATVYWEMRAARGECGWICADCCLSFADGMPDQCAHGIKDCTDIIERDKKLAKEQS